MAEATASVADFWTSRSPWPALPVSYLGDLSGADLADTDINALIGGVIAAERGQSFLAWQRYQLAAALHDRLVTPGPFDFLIRDGLAECAARLAYALSISQTAAEKTITQAVALRDRLPQVSTRLRDGRVTAAVVATIITRTELCHGQPYAADVDATIAARLDAHTGAWSAWAVRDMVDRIIIGVDPDAVREQRRRALTKRRITTRPGTDGTAHLTITAAAEDVQVAHATVTDIAGRAVCEHDPRTRAQRESDVAIARLLGIPFGCDCDRDDCTATPIDPSTAPAVATSTVVIHVVTDEATLDGRASNPGVLDGHGITGGDHIRDLATRPDAIIKPVVPPGTPVQPDGSIDLPATRPTDTYRPSTALDTYIRIRDGHSVIPGTTTPAWAGDIDHVTEYDHTDPAAGGQTLPDNLNVKDRFNHLLKTYGDWLDDQWRDPNGVLRQEFITPEGLRIPGEPDNHDTLFPGLRRIRFTTHPHAPPTTATTGPTPPGTEPTRTTPRVAAKHARRRAERHRNRQLRQQFDK